MNLDEILTEYIEEYGPILACHMYHTYNTIYVHFGYKFVVINRIDHRWEVIHFLDSNEWKLQDSIVHMEQDCWERFQLSNAPHIACIDKILEFASNLTEIVYIGL